MPRTMYTVVSQVRDQDGTWLVRLRPDVQGAKLCLLRVDTGGRGQATGDRPPYTVPAVVALDPRLVEEEG